MKKILLITASVILTIVNSPVHSQLQNTERKSALANFEALQKGNSVQISWTALYELDVNRHEIQKSTNGSSFTNIGNVVAQNNAAPFRYTFLDATPVEGNNFYRLRTVDKQGNETFSNILMVNNGVGRTDMRVLPNPVQGGVLNLQLTNINRGKYAISLYSNAGQKVFARSLDLSDGSLNERINLPQNLGRGVYFLQLTNGDMRVNRQVFLQ